MTGPWDPREYADAKRRVLERQASPATKSEEPPRPAAPRNEAFDAYTRASTPLQSEYIARRISRRELLSALHGQAKAYGVEHLVDWDEYGFDDKEVDDVPQA
ncbi:MAG TPA: hypothetical protein PLU44_17295 [Candidatus Krumholzibacteria bacterium]|nr:hypothetical protein [Candidatus Krumholzibacteria bacterium]